MLQVDISSFSYDDKKVLQNISFCLNPGEHLSLLGESGCGKSTLLKLLYGLLHLENGSISYNGRQLLGPTKTLIPGEEFIKLVSQELDLMPYSTVYENIRFFLKTFNEEEDSKRINELLKVIDMREFKDTMVKKLSGGQKQRVALAKALADEPEILLLDEAFSNIDSLRKNRLRRNIFDYLKKKQITCIIATHDSDEALSFSDTIIMMRDGEVEMQGTSEYIYKNVSNLYQASFFGDGMQLPRNILGMGESVEEVILFPYQLKISNAETLLKVSVKKSYFKGSHYLVESFLKDRIVFFQHSTSLQTKENVWLEYSAKK